MTGGAGPVSREGGWMSGKAGQMAARPAPPVKPATWEWYVPAYFWLGGISAGSFMTAAAEDLAGGRDRRVVRAARYLSFGAILAGTGCLIADLGRPERFHHMLRIVRPTSAMSLGSWGLTAFGGCTGVAALLQGAEDGLFGDGRLSRMSRGRAGRALHALGLPLAVFVGGYTGVLLASTSTPSWARRTTVLGPLFLASAFSSGLAAVSIAAEAAGGASEAALKRLSRAEAAALAAELALASLGEARVRDLPSRRDPTERAALAAYLAAGVALPLALSLARLALRRRPERAAHSPDRARSVPERAGSMPERTPRGSEGRSPGLELLGAGLALAGSLALRYLVTRQGERSAGTPGDTWAFASDKPYPALPSPAAPGPRPA